MPDFYPITTIQPEWVLKPEALGSKRKFWYRQANGESDWLFKYPEQNTGQHWAEKIATEIAALLDISHARVDLAIFQGNRGSTTESFMRDGQSLFHGNQIMAGHVFGYDPKVRRFQQSHHTLDNIFLALDKTFATPEGALKAKTHFADYLVLDAVIGNTDRHHENWGILLKQDGNHWVGNLAPTFDHASSLGRELLDESKRKQCRRWLLDENQVGSYAEKAPGAIYQDKQDKQDKKDRKVSPLALVRWAAELHPEIFRPALDRVKRLDKISMEKIVRQVPEDWMNPLERRFSVEFMCYSAAELRRIS